MKIIEILSGLTVPITNEEQDVLNYFDDGDLVLKTSLNEREQEVANSLINKDIIMRKRNDEGKVVYVKKVR